MPVLLLAVCILAAHADSPPQLFWLSSFEQAVKVSNVQGRPLLLEITTSWSPFNKAMRRTTWRHPHVVALAQRFVLARVDAEHDPYLANHYRVDGYPTYLLMYDGHDLGRDVGLVPPAEMVKLLSTALNSWEMLRYGRTW
ncbi:MAG: thioredoxin family protein [Candidatus Xenobia bacterium]